MIRLDVITTRGGDAGQTSLGDGSRVGKESLRIEAIGAVDEANAALGLLRLHTTGEPDAMLARIQNDLFDLGSDLATPGKDPEGTQSLRITPAQTDWLEQQIDYYNEGLQPLRSFVLPGGTPLAVALHLARTVTRRAERLVVQLLAKEPDTSGAVLIYLNRLSDLLFVMARVANANGETDVLWAPGKFADAAAVTKG